MKRRAVVAGGGVGGLLAARVLAEHFGTVTVIERDCCPVGRNPRAGAPQGRHVHVLLPSGVEALESLFPGCIAELVRDGAKRFDYGQSRIHTYGTWLPRVGTGLMALAQTRPFLEQHLHRWAGQVPNIEVIYGASVRAPFLDGSRSRAAGVEFSTGNSACVKRLEADLVVDATGRNTRLLRWLDESGFGRVAESRMGIDLGYATGRFRVAREYLPESALLYVVGPPPSQTKVGVIFQAEDGVVLAGLGGYHGDYPPADFAGFLQFARSLSQPDIINVLARGELCSCIERFRIPAPVRHRYRKVRNFPERLLPIGDSVCSLDPAFGQGMTLAAQEAKILARCLEEHPKLERSFTEEYFRRTDNVVDVAWGVSSRENLRYPQTMGVRPWYLPIATRYMNLVMHAGDPQVAAEVYRVISLTASSKTVLRPSVAARAMTAALKNGLRRMLHSFRKTWGNTDVT